MVVGVGGALFLLGLVVLVLWGKFLALDQLVEFVYAALFVVGLGLVLLVFGDEFGFLLFLLWVVL